MLSTSEYYACCAYGTWSYLIKQFDPLEKTMAEAAWPSVRRRDFAAQTILLGARVKRGADAQARDLLAVAARG